MNSPQKEKQKITMRTMTTTAALTLAVFGFLGVAVTSAISMLSPTQQAYAQSSGVSVNIECVLDDDGSPVVSWLIENINSIKPATGGYGYMVLEGDRLIDGLLLHAPSNPNGFVTPITKTFDGERGQEYTIQTVLDDNLDFFDVQVIASESVTCPPLPEPEDTTPPVVTVPNDITVEVARSEEGAEVSFDVSALDVVDGAVGVTCTPESDSTFRVGETTVTCSATDEAGNEGTASFTVTVSYQPLTEEFSNRGLCIREANTNPDAGFTREDCQNAFRNVEGGGGN